MAKASIINNVFIETFCSHVRISGSIETAIKQSGITRERYCEWARQVRQGKGTNLQRRFMRAVEKAEGEAKLIREHMLSKHFDKHWGALAWWLERKYANEYGLRRRTDPDIRDERPQPERVVWIEAPAAAPTKTKPVAADPKPIKAPKDGLPNAVELNSDALGQAHASQEVDSAPEPPVEIPHDEGATSACTAGLDKSAPACASSPQAIVDSNPRDLGENQLIN